MIQSVKDFHSAYGILIGYAWRIVFYPVLALVLYSGGSYLDSKYVPRADFASYKEANASGLDRINAKLDTLLMRDSANTQQTSDILRRLNRVEDKLDTMQPTGKR